MFKGTNARTAQILSATCIALYLAIFATVFSLGLSNGTSVDKMLALTQADTSDVTEYIQLAHSMIEDHKYSLPFSGTEYLRTPGYPFFVAFNLIVFKTLYIIPLLQILFTSATVAFIFLIGVRYFPKPVAILAACLYMIDPIAMYAAWTPITESIFMFFFISSIFTIGLRSQHDILTSILAGFLFGCAVYVKPVGLVLIPLFAVLAFVERDQWRLRMRYAAIVVATFVVTVSPWMVRNYIQAGHFAFASNQVWQFYAVNMPLFQQARTGVGFQQVLHDNNDLYFGGEQDEHILRSFAYADKQAEITKGVLLAHPYQYLAFHAFKSLQFFVSSSIVNVTYHMHKFGILTGDHAQGEGAWGMILKHQWREAMIQTFTHVPRLLERILLALLYLGSIATTLIALRTRRNALWIACIFLMLNAVAFLTGPGSDDTRYRMPSEPFVFLLGAYAAYLLGKRLWHSFKPANQLRLLFGA